MPHRSLGAARSGWGGFFFFLISYQYAGGPQFICPLRETLIGSPTELQLQCVIWGVFCLITELSRMEQLTGTH